MSMDDLEIQPGSGDVFLEKAKARDSEPGGV
jgi:hypothetical protein